MDRLIQILDPRPPVRTNNGESSGESSGELFSGFALPDSAQLTVTEAGPSGSNSMTNVTPGAINMMFDNEAGPSGINTYVNTTSRTAHISQNSIAGLPGFNTMPIATSGTAAMTHDNGDLRGISPIPSARALRPRVNFDMGNPSSEGSIAESHQGIHQNCYTCMYKDCTCTYKDCTFLGSTHRHRQVQLYNVCTILVCSNRPRKAKRTIYVHSKFSRVEPKKAKCTSPF